MKVTLISTSDLKGGASIACYRLMKSLNALKQKAKMVVQNKQANEPDIVSISNNFIKKKLSFFRFALERMMFTFFEKSKKVRFAFSLANIGTDITPLPEIQCADIIHLHWINQGFISLSGLKRLSNLNKPMIWTLHDMWAFTGGCHYSGECMFYKEHCGNCIFLKSPKSNDLSYRIWQRKRETYNGLNLTFVTCSQWLAKLAKESTLLKGCRIEAIPNPIDITIYKPIQKNAAREKMSLPSQKFLILFAAMNTSDDRKGFSYFKESLNILKKKYQKLNNKIELVVFGKSNDSDIEQLPFKTNNLGSLSDTEQIVSAYNAATIFILPSLEDNLPNTIMESFSCKTPVVAFNTGGIPEMIDHKKNGYIADYKSAESLAEGIKWILEDKERYQNLCDQARNKVMKNYTYEIVGKRYIDLYKELLANNQSADIN